MNLFTNLASDTLQLCTSFHVYFVHIKMTPDFVTLRYHGNNVSLIINNDVRCQEVLLWELQTRGWAHEGSHTRYIKCSVYVGTANSYYSRVNNLKDVFMNNSKNINSGGI